MGRRGGRDGLEDTTAPTAGLDRTTLASPNTADLDATTGPGAGGSTDGVALQRGALIGRYIVLDFLGEGAMGVVYAAIDPELDRKVAVKLLQHGQDGSLAHDPDARGRLVREAQALARLNHPNVVGVFDVGTHGDRVWIAMELVVGRTLRDWLVARDPDWRAVLDVMQAAGRGLAAAHAAGLVHRDIKPDNIMLGDDGRVRVMDFGLARRGAEQHGAGRAAPDSGATTMLSSDMTHAGALVGTPAYMAPEQFRGDAVGPLVDVFAFSVMLWEGLYGSRPFVGASLDELRANIEAGRTEAAPRRSAVPRWFAPILARGLATAPGERWPSMDALLTALAQAQVRARRRLAAFAFVLVLGLAAALAGGVALAEQRSRAGCAAEGAEIFRDWSETTRADIERTFAATGKPNASVVFEKTAPWLNRWATSWHVARTQICVENRLDRTLTDDLRARAEDCLDDLRSDFVALLGELTHADAGTLNRATTAAADLSPVAACMDPLVLRERPLPSIERRAAVRALRSQLSRVLSMRASGKPREALELAKQTAVAAQAADWPAITTEALYHVGALEARFGERATAEETLLRALAEARAARSSSAAATAMIPLIDLTGGKASRAWAEAIQNELLHVPGDTRLLQASLDAMQAELARIEGRYEDARRLSERNLAARIEVLGEEHPKVASTLNTLATAIDRQGDHEEAIRLFERAIAIATRTLGPDHPEIGDILPNLAVAHGQLGHDDEAFRITMRTLALTERHYAPTHDKVLIPLVNLATVHLIRGELQEALAIYERALARIDQAPEKTPGRKATILTNCSTIHYIACRDAVGLRDAMAALQLAERDLGKDHPTVAGTLAVVARGRLRLGELDEALRVAERSLSIGETALGKDHPVVAESLLLLGTIHRARGRTDEALRLHERAAAIAEAGQGGDLASIRGELAESLLAANRTAEAQVAAERALLVATSPLDDAPAIRFTLARALWEAGSDRPRARALAQQAAAEARCARSRAEIEAWLAAHPP